MRILFATDAMKKVSTQLNAPNYARLNELDGVQIDFYNRNYADYDVVLFMGYDARVTEARTINPFIKIGVIDPRPPKLNEILGADFVIANGIEMQDWLADYFENIFIYPIYPLVNGPLKVHEKHEPLIIGYHGNKVHLMAALPHITIALEALSEYIELELWVIYDIRSLGEMPFELCDPKKVKVRYFQWKEDVYETLISKVDIGIVPNQIPFKDEMLAKKQIEPFSPLLQPHESDFLMRFKNTSNAGRIYVFSQLGIPVIAGMIPSASQAIRHGRSGYLANSSGSWYSALKNLANSAELRAQMGRVLYEDFLRDVSPGVLNQRLINFISGIEPQSQYPVGHFAGMKQKVVKTARSKTAWNQMSRIVKKIIRSRY
jgi:glycosyltransferase involved in cell wall biosynthesis